MLWKSFTARAPSTRRSLRLRTSTTSIPIIFEYMWRLAQSSIPYSSPSTWIRRPSSRWSKTGCSSVTMTFTDRLSWYVLIFSTYLLVLRSNFLLTSILQVMTAIRNMSRQHREFQSRLDDTEKMQLYAQSTVSKIRPWTLLWPRRNLGRRFRSEAKASAEKIERTKKEREEAKQ